MPWKLRLRERFSVPLLYLSRDPGLTMAGRRSMARELRALNRQTRAYMPLKPGGLGSRPLIVLTRPADDMMPQSGGWDVWRNLHQELGELSHNHGHVITSALGLYIHLEDPDLVTQSIRDVVASARTDSPL